MKPYEPPKRDEVTAMFITAVVRNVMERVHKDLTDEQMDQLTSTIRDATFTALHAMANHSRSEGARAYVYSHTLMIPRDGEEPELLDDYVVSEAMLDAYLQGTAPGRWWLTV